MYICMFQIPKFVWYMYFPSVYIEESLRVKLENSLKKSTPFYYKPLKQSMEQIYKRNKFILFKMYVVSIEIVNREFKNVLYFQIL